MAGPGGDADGWRPDRSGILGQWWQPSGRAECQCRWPTPWFSGAGGWPGGGQAAVLAAGVTDAGGGSRVRVAARENRWVAAWRCVSKFDLDEMPRGRPCGIGFQQLLWAYGSPHGN
jgi:hypothetical protein